MDELDRKVVKLLQQNGRASNAEVARRVGVSEGTVRRRLKRLIQAGEIRVVAIPDPQKMGYVTEALIGIKVDPDKIESVAARLGEVEDAQYVAATTGAYDIFVWVMVPTSEDLRTFLRERVATLAGVRSSETFVSLSVKKRAYGIAGL